MNVMTELGKRERRNYLTWPLMHIFKWEEAAVIRTNKATDESGLFELLVF